MQNNPSSNFCQNIQLGLFATEGFHIVVITVVHNILIKFGGSAAMIVQWPKKTSIICAYNDTVDMSDTKF